MPEIHTIAAGWHVVDLIVRRNGETLVPASPYDLEQLDKMRPGRSAACVIKYPRSLQHQRWWRALVGIVAEGLGMQPGTLHAELKLKAGLIAHIWMRDGKPMTELKSTAFGEMDEEEFTAFTRAGVEIIFAHYLPGVERENVFERVRAMCDGEND